MPLNFAIIGVAGYVAPRHLRAIRDSGNTLIAAVDPHDSAALLDQYGFDIRFFTEPERFERHLHKLRRDQPERQVHYVSICSPNYLHDAHCRIALHAGAHVICEKPLVINPWNLDALQELEAESGCRINTVLQLRLHPGLLQLKQSLASPGAAGQHEVVLTNISGRGPWYWVSWKGDLAKSGGLATNIGIHLFDLLIWLFGPVVDVKLHHREDSRLAGFIELERARVRWFLSVADEDVPTQIRQAGRHTHRLLQIDGREIDYSDGFEDLHTRVYQEVLAGRGLGIEHARPSIALTHRIRTAAIVPANAEAHPLLRAGR